MAEKQLGSLVRHTGNAGAGECDEHMKLTEYQWPDGDMKAE